MNDAELRQFTEFVNARQAGLLRLAWVLTGEQGAAEDLVQSALARTAARWRHVRDSPEAYVRTAMYHEQVSWWRSLRRRRETVPGDLPDVGAADDTGRVDLRLSMERALLTLPARSRAVLPRRDIPSAAAFAVLGGTRSTRTHKRVARGAKEGSWIGELPVMTAEREAERMTGVVP